jgi:hypothetical protein
MRTTKI